MAAGDDVLAPIAAADRAAARASLAEAFATGQPARFECQARVRVGGERSLAWTVLPHAEDGVAY